MERRAARLRRCVLACLAVLAIAATPFVGSASAQAQVVGFNPGNIISDSLFYNGNAMSASEVQAFLNQRVPRCTIGDAGRAAGMQWGTTRIADKCLRDFSMPTISRSANALCDAYIGRPNETAAEIIAKVGQACGISQRVLLITLEKEQSLVSDSWPTERQIAIATGYACPDSGPNWSANCNPEYYGFQNQVYYAAWQLKLYRANPQNYNFKPFQVNNIQYHPNPACGSSPVYIENWATAALYIYTPYQPNAASLAAGWGTGDGCSTYGNRNFYNLYTSWFGSPSGFTVSGDIATYWNARGAENSVYGYPSGPASFRTSRFPGGLYVQNFSGGVIVTEMNTGVTAGIPRGPIYDHINTVMDGVFGALGAPVGDQLSYAVNGGAILQVFQGGTVIVALREGTVASIPYDAVYDLYNGELDGIYGPLGYPTSNFASYSGGKLQNFQQGFIARANGSSELVYMVRGPFYDYYDAANGIYGRLGFPLSSVVTDANGTSTQEYQNGFLVQRPGQAVVEVSGAQLASYRAAAASGNPLGAPTSGVLTTALNGGAEYQRFEHGVVVTPKATRTTVSLSGRIYEHYDQVMGGFDGPYGYPTGQPRVLSENGGGILQLFQHGAALVSNEAATVAGIVDGTQIQKRYNEVEGGIYGWLGLPTGDEILSPDGTKSQQFQHGAILIDGSGRAVVLPRDTYQHYQESGSAGGPLGAQVAPTRKYPVGEGLWLSFFRNGEILEDLGTGATATLLYSSLEYRRYNNTEDGIYGWLGLPIADVVVGADGTRSQQFRNGVISTGPDGITNALPGATLAHFLSQGASAGSLGNQVAKTRRYDVGTGSWISFFAKGQIVQSIADGTTATVLFDSPIYKHYNSPQIDGIYGSLGLPIADEVLAPDGSRSQRFQNGTLTYANGVVTRS